MTPFEAAALGILQGLTEFLPVSSSGHLVLAQSLIPNFSQPGVLFDAVLHGGTLVAVVWYFRKTLFSLNQKMLGLLLLGTIPAAAAGILFQSQIESLFSTPKLVGGALLITGLMNLLVDRNWKLATPASPSEAGRAGSWKVTMPKALVVGLFQAVALIPGISRSGSTIFAGVAQGIKKEEAAIFSFLLSIPAVLGAVGLQFLAYGSSNSLETANYLVGFLAALAVGYFTIGFLMRMLLAKRFKVFAVYCFVAGLTALLISG